MTATSLHAALKSHSRLPLAAEEPAAISAREVAVLLALGATAAALTELIDFSLRAPGHAILRSVVPLAFGLALAPRHGAGSLMGLGALAAAGAIRVGGWGGGLGSLTSVVLLGPFLDATLARARSGLAIYAGAAGGALLANLAAFGVQLAVKLTAGGGRGGGRGLTEWLPVAAWTYPLFGLVAGLASAALWFRLRPRPANRHG